MTVEYIKKSKTSAMDWSLVETLRALADDIEKGEADYNKMFICLLDDTKEGKYLHSFRMAQMKGSEAVALLEIVKSDIAAGMNGVHSNFMG